MRPSREISHRSDIIICQNTCPPPPPPLVFLGFFGNLTPFEIRHESCAVVTRRRDLRDVDVRKKVTVIDLFVFIAADVTSIRLRM